MEKPGRLPESGYVIFDNHMHLNTEGRFLEAVDMFLGAGGDTFNLVNLPDANMQLDDYYERLYARTLKMAEILRKERGMAVPVTLGPYPLDYFRFREHVADPVQALREGVDRAARLVSQGLACAIGEVGRPHFPVPDDVAEASDAIMLYCMETAADLDCPVILHTDDLDHEGYRKLETIADKAGLRHDLVVKHHALPQDFSIETRILRSVLASRSNVRKITGSGKAFLLETDYVDDVKLGWKVIPPDSVPRRAVMIRNECEDWERVFTAAFREGPIRLFGEDVFRKFL